MLDAKVSISWHMVFNNTGLDHMRYLQSRFIELIGRACVLHCIPTDLREATDSEGKDVVSEEVIEGVSCKLYIAYDWRDKHIDCFAIKNEKASADNADEESEDA